MCIRDRFTPGVTKKLVRSVGVPGVPDRSPIPASPNTTTADEVDAMPKKKSANRDNNKYGFLKIDT